ncbi:MAG: NAD+ synthase [Leptolyngbya sp. PLA3]|nr:MAG: NAD+ synthase [Cyanobacteria bacterium CYA]MCE7968720.1 NAD+ synthase [Leptolyngbya sp. PL-A3]
MRVALAQINPTVGDVPGNAAACERAITQARDAGARLVVLPELCISGYPPKDLVHRPDFIRACAATAKRVGESCTRGLTAVIGTPLPLDSAGISNSLVVYRDNALVNYYDKRLLPTYDVFDEDRYFVPGSRAVVIDVDGTRVGLAICEDLWRGEDAGFASRYLDAPDPVFAAVDAGARLLVVPSASPYVLGKHDRHVSILRSHATRHGVPVCSVNQVGGNDDLIFDGRACVIAPDGSVAAQAPAFREHLLIHDLGSHNGHAGESELGVERNVVEALTLGIRDYLRKTGFRKALIGLSGGVDSALTAALAVRALGSDNVFGVALPSRYSSEHSRTDAHDLAERLGITCLTVPIVEAHGAMHEAINPAFSEMGQRLLGQTLPDLADENLQSRLRGTILMTISNRTGALVLTTGNKSELAVGYCTLYGDMNGGLAVLSDVPKTLVYRVSRWMNEHPDLCGFASSPIPERTIIKPPSAELAPHQKDSDSLPEYDVLDVIIERWVERHEDVATIVKATGFDESLVRRVARLIDVNEYKRKQMAVGLKVTELAFGSGRRMPIARGWW